MRMCLHVPLRWLPPVLSYEPRRGTPIVNLRPHSVLSSLGFRHNGCPVDIDIFAGMAVAKEAIAVLKINQFTVPMRTLGERRLGVCGDVI